MCFGKGLNKESRGPTNLEIIIKKNVITFLNSFQLNLVEILSTHGAESADDGTKSFVKQQLSGSDFAPQVSAI